MADLKMFELLIVLILIFINGLLALSELAVVSSRQMKLRALAESGRAGAHQALALAKDPRRFLSTVQAGITLIGIATGTYSGAVFGEKASNFLLQLGVPTSISEPLGVSSVVVLITYLSVIIGELVPKNLALRNPEALASVVAPVMAFLSELAGPAVWLLNTSAELIFKLFGGTTAARETVTEEEIKTIIAEAESAGVPESGERRLISAVLRLSDRPARALMTPRADVDWLDLSGTKEQITHRLITTVHSLLPAGRGSPDRITGVVQSQKLLVMLLSGKPLDAEAVICQAPAVPENIDALDVLEILRKADIPMVLVHDEYGRFEGVVTPADILEAVAGVFKSDSGSDEEGAVQREDGSWLLSGWMLIDNVSERLGLPLPPGHGYQTVAGFVFAQLYHIPAAGEYVDAGGWRFEVVGVDGRRIDKVLATRLPIIRHRAA